MFSFFSPKSRCIWWMFRGTYYVSGIVLSPSDKELPQNASLTFSRWLVHPPEVCHSTSTASNTFETLREVSILVSYLDITTDKWPAQKVHRGATSLSISKKFSKNKLGNRCTKAMNYQRVGTWWVEGQVLGCSYLGPYKGIPFAHCTNTNLCPLSVSARSFSGACWTPPPGWFTQIQPVPKRTNTLLPKAGAPGSFDTILYRLGDRPDSPGDSPQSYLICGYK